MNFSHQYVADLAWLLEQPGLLSLNNQNYPGHPVFLDSIIPHGFESLWSQTLAELNCQPEPIIEYINARKTRRVGFYYEALVSFLIKHFKGLDLIAEHMQLQLIGKTLGEIDFIFQRDKKPKATHLETAVKFYLGVQSRINEHAIYEHWIGPMVKDRLDLKFNHLVNHQTKLSEHPAFSNKAEELDITLPLTKEVLLQGYLFVHPNEPLPHPDELNNTEKLNNTENVFQDFWIKEHQIEDFLNKNDRFIILEKPFWISRYHDKKQNKLLLRSQLSRDIHTLIEHWNRPVLISVISTYLEENNDAHYRLYKETKRCFIVPNKWAGIA